MIIFVNEKQIALKTVMLSMKNNWCWADASNTIISSVFSYYRDNLSAIPETEFQKKVPNLCKNGDEKWYMVKIFVLETSKRDHSWALFS